MKYDSRVVEREWKKVKWRFETGCDRQMGFATWIIHLICRSCSCRSGWPQFIADTHLLFDRYFSPQEHKGSRSHTDGARGIPLPLVFFSAPSRLVFSLCASGPTVGLPTAFWCIRCHSFYLSITLFSLNVVYFHCCQWCVAFHSHVIADTWTSGQIKQWHSNPLNRLYSNTSSETLTSGSRSYGYEDQGDTFYFGKCKALSVTWRLTPLRL